MQGPDVDQLIAQLDEILASFGQLSSKSRQHDLSDLPEQDIHRLITQARAAITRIAGAASPYGEQLSEVLSRKVWDTHKLQYLVGIIQALKHDLMSGYMTTAEELIHGELFSDFLEMASYLLDEGFKDAAAVIAGSSLEAHLRQLSKKYGVPITTASDSSPRPRKADTINADLAKAGAYSNLDLKNITAWLDLRNKAAHGQYEEYSASQVQLMVSSIRDFFTRMPA